MKFLAYRLKPLDNLDDIKKRRKWIATRVGREAESDSERKTMFGGAAVTGRMGTLVDPLEKNRWRIERPVLCTMVFLVSLSLSTYLFPNGFEQDEIRERNPDDERTSINVAILRSLCTPGKFLVLWSFGKVYRYCSYRDYRSRQRFIVQSYQVRGIFLRGINRKIFERNSPLCLWISDKMAKISAVSWNIFLHFRAMPLRQSRNSGELLSPKGRTATKRDIWIVEAWDPRASGEHVSPCECTLLPDFQLLFFYDNSLTIFTITDSPRREHSRITFVALTRIFFPRPPPFPSKRV